VTLTGRGWETGDKYDDILHIAHCDGVTIADVSFADCRSYGIKVEAEHEPRNVQILHCRFRDIGVRAIKGSAGQNPNLRAVKGRFVAAISKTPKSRRPTGCSAATTLPPST
jgi:hypothetical protein